MSRKELALLIKMLRKEKHLSQAELARLAGVSPVTINTIEHEGNTSLEILDKLSKVLEYPLY